jgi:4-amino-4-deoxy-L-arabinose transferase-like glycosyltransferase
MFSGAPSFDVLGSFFPVWMLCIVAAILLTIVVGWLLARADLEAELGPRALIYPSMVTLFACAIWLILFR